jgi:hypothetical protein
MIIWLDDSCILTDENIISSRPRPPGWAAVNSDGAPYCRIRLCSPRRRWYLHGSGLQTSGKYKRTRSLVRRHGGSRKKRKSIGNSFQGLNFFGSAMRSTLQCTCAKEALSIDPYVCFVVTTGPLTRTVQSDCSPLLVKRWFT